MDGPSPQTQHVIRRIVNPDRGERTLYYPGAGPDLLGPFLETDATRYVFVDLVDVAYGDIDAQQESIIRQITDQGGRIENDAWSPPKIWRVTFELEGRERTLTYHFQRDVLEFSPPELQDGYDIYYSRGSGPFNQPHYLAEKVAKLTLGGDIVSHDCDLMSHGVIVDGDKRSQPLAVDREALGLDVWQVRDAAGPIYVMQKQRMVSAENMLQLLLPGYFKLLLLDIRGLLEDWNSAAPQLFGAMLPIIDYTAHLQRCIREACQLWLLLPEPAQRRYASQMESIMAVCRPIEASR